ncbi:MAG: T9SS type A sorting domain-containing protein [Ignavibacteria bacterium]|nr:T9SS type A sorting domain-containing protein [Ignavibacteria bacterium]
MKKIAFLFVFLIAYMLHAEGTNIQGYIPCQVKSVYKYITTSGGTDYDSTRSDQYYLGREDGKLGRSKPTFRIILRLDLSQIPDSAVISRIYFNYSFYTDSAASNFNYKFKSFPYATTGLSNEFDQCGNVANPAFRAGVNTSAPFGPSFLRSSNADTAFLNSVEKSLSQKKYAVCLIGDPDTINHKFAEMRSVLVYVEYMIPTITIRNLFGGGTLKVNGKLYPSGTSISAKIGRTFTFEAYDQQYNNQLKYFDKWQYGGNTYSGKTFTFTFDKYNAYISNNQLIALFNDPARTIAENDILMGTMKIDNNVQTTPIQISRAPNTTVRLDAINQTLGDYEYIWNSSSPQQRSNWFKVKLDDNTPTNLYQETNPTLSFNITANDSNYSYRSMMRKNYHIARKDSLLENAQSEQCLNITQVVEQNTGQLTAPYGKNIAGYPVTFFSWADGTAGTLNNVNGTLVPTRDITPTDNLTYTAKYKAIHRSNNDSTYKNNSAKKMARSKDGYLFTVYESMGSIWLERSTDNGSSWQIMNSGKPLNTAPAKNPALDVNPYDIAVTFEQEGNVWMKFYTRDGVYTQEKQVSSQYANEKKPVLCWNTSLGLVIWALPCTNTFTRGFGYYLFSYQGWSGAGGPAVTTLDSGICLVAGSNLSYDNFALDMVNESGVKRFHLAWTARSATGADIYYKTMDVASGTNTLDRSVPVQNISSGSGYTYNTNPSIICGLAGARVSWLGERQVNTPPPDGLGRQSAGASTYTTGTTERKVIVKDPTYYRFWDFGNDVNPPSMAHTDSVYVFAWTEPRATGYAAYYGYHNLSTIYTIPGTWGRDIQVGNARQNQTAGFGHLFAGNLYPQALPYEIKTTPDFQSIQGLQKTDAAGSINSGREGVVAKDSAQFWFCIGDVSINGKHVEFTELPMNLHIQDVDGLNSAMETRVFPLTPGSKLSYSVQYGVNDSAFASVVLAGNNEVHFRVELVEAVSGKVLEAFDNVTYNSLNVQQYNNIAYEVQNELSGSKEVFLRLRTQSTINGELNISDKYASQSVLPKAAAKRVVMGGKDKVTNYALEQNYPNPFNPTTTINYQIPKSGHVILKIYDMLGREVETLVNGQMTAGRYSVVFNAAHLASGVYVYELRCGEFSSSRKLLLMK